MTEENSTQVKEKPAWDVQRVHKEVYDARTRMFVTLKVLETGAVEFKEHPEWVLVIKPLLKELTEFSEKINSLMELKTSSEESA
jgi:hypothetical protein